MSDLDHVAASIRFRLDKLEHRQTGRDPKLNAYAYAEIPDWLLRQWLHIVEEEAKRR